MIDAAAGLAILAASAITPAVWYIYCFIQPAAVAAILAIAIEDYGALRTGSHPIQIFGDQVGGDKMQIDDILSQAAAIGRAAEAELLED